MQIPVDPRTGMPVEVSFDWIATLPRSLRTWLRQRKLEQVARQLRQVPDADLKSIGLGRLREP